ncbi:hypothetical protein EI94DRAFT_1791020 [Lactarius quietus]|nr:hypothetical protein EI94DRAFT_1791020 [Lactarius quietus]
MHMPLFVSHITTRTLEEADAKPIRRCSTTISMMEEEFGMRTPPRAVGRFGIPSKLCILLPKRRHSTQAPEQHRCSFLSGSWETVWDCDAEGSYLVESPPNEDTGGHLEGVLCGGMHCDEPDSDPEATTPIGASWSTDGEATPLFSSNFPRQLDYRDESKLLEGSIAADDSPVDSRLK